MDIISSSPVVEQVPTSSTCKKLPDKLERNSYQRRSIWIHAKRIFRKRLLSKLITSKSCKMELTLNIEAMEGSQEIISEADKSSDSVHHLLAPVLLQVFPYLDIYDRIRLRRVSYFNNSIFNCNIISK